MDRLAGKVAVITGASLGIGRAIATRMAGEGAAVALLDRLDEEGRALVDDLSARNLRAHYWRCDVSRETDVKNAIDAVADHFGRLDVVVCNAGITGANKLTHELTEEEWDATQAVNVKGVFFCTKHAVPHLRRAGGGSIIYMSSVYGIVSAADASPYHASKGAVRIMSKTDALSYAPDKIRVNSIHPGFIWTPMVEKHFASLDDPEGTRTAAAALHPIGHMGDPDDIAWGAVYLASDEAKFVTGTELVIDGGYTAH